MPRRWTRGWPLWRDDAGGGSLLEWAGALALVVLLALGLELVGAKARYRIAGDSPSQEVGRTFGGVLAGGALVDDSRERVLDELVVDVPHAIEAAPESNDPKTSEPQLSTEQCADGFVNGAWRAFVANRGDGQIVGDLVGVTDADLKEWLWDRPANEVLGDVARAATNAAPGIWERTPGFFGGLRDGAVAWVGEDVDALRHNAGNLMTRGPAGMAQDWRANKTARVAGQAVDMIFVDSFRTLGTLGTDGWHGSGVLIAAAQIGDCAAFGETLRSGVNNVPELTLALTDAVPLAVGGAKALQRTARAGKTLAVAKLTGRTALHASKSDALRAIGKLTPSNGKLTHARTTLSPPRTPTPARTLPQTPTLARTPTLSHTPPPALHAAASLAFGHGAAPALVRALSAATAHLPAFTRVFAVASHATAPVLGLSQNVYRAATHAVTAATRYVDDALTRALAGTDGSMMASIGFCFTAGTEVHTPTGRVSIEKIELGDRVSSLTAQQGMGTAVNADWRRIDLEMRDVRSADGTIRLAILRPPAWIRATGARTSREIDLSLEEMGVRGKARVLSIDAAPRIREGAGRVVLATIESESAHVLKLRFHDSREVLEPTAAHRLFSLDRNEWTRADALRVGERLRTREGVVVIDSIERKPGIHRVYNLEVETDHSYFVGTSGVLSHNDIPCAADISRRRIEGQLRALAEARDIALKDEIAFLIERGGHEFGDDVLGPFYRESRVLAEGGFDEMTYVRARDLGIAVDKEPILQRYHVARQRMLDEYDRLRATDFGPEWTQEFPLFSQLLPPEVREVAASSPTLVRALKALQTPVAGKRFGVSLEDLSKRVQARIEREAQRRGHIGERWRVERLPAAVAEPPPYYIDPTFMRIQLRVYRPRTTSQIVDDLAHAVGQARVYERNLTPPIHAPDTGPHVARRAFREKAESDIFAYEVFRELPPLIRQQSDEFSERRARSYSQYLIHRDRERTRREFAQIHVDEFAGNNSALHRSLSRIVRRLDTRDTKARPGTGTGTASERAQAAWNLAGGEQNAATRGTIRFPGLSKTQSAELRAIAPPAGADEEIAAFRVRLEEHYRDASPMPMPDVADYGPTSSFANPREAFVARSLNARMAQEGNVEVGVRGAQRELLRRRGIDIGAPRSDVGEGLNAETARLLDGHEVLETMPTESMKTMLDEMRDEAGAVWDEAHGEQWRQVRDARPPHPELNAPPGEPNASAGRLAYQRNLDPDRYVLERADGRGDWFLRDVETDRTFVFRRNDPQATRFTRQNQRDLGAGSHSHRFPPAAAVIAEQFHLATPPSWTASWNRNVGSLEEVFPGVLSRDIRRTRLVEATGNVQALEYITGAVQLEDGRVNLYTPRTPRTHWVPGEMDQLFPTGSRRYPREWEDRIDVARVLPPRTISVQFRDDLARFLSETNALDDALAPYLNREERRAMFRRAQYLMDRIRAGDIASVRETFPGWRP